MSEHEAVEAEIPFEEQLAIDLYADWSHQSPDSAKEHWLDPKGFIDRNRFRKMVSMSLAAYQHHLATRSSDAVVQTVDELIGASYSAGLCSNGGSGLVPDDEDRQAEVEYQQQVDALRVQILALIAEHARGPVVSDEGRGFAACPNSECGGYPGNDDCSYCHGDGSIEVDSNGDYLEAALAAPTAHPGMPARGKGCRG